jgi:OOP family OmpA-OmpF porin
MERIQKFADFLKQHPEVKAEIQGYTDNRGSAAYNKKLSERRAKAVYEALINLGVSKEQLSYKGYGAENPIASNDTEEGRAKNRRVVAKLSF